MKKIGKIFTALLLVVSLTGCMKADIDFQVKDMENVSVVMSGYYNEDLLLDKVDDLIEEIMKQALKEIYDTEDGQALGMTFDEFLKEAKKELESSSEFQQQYDDMKKELEEALDSDTLLDSFEKSIMDDMKEGNHASFEKNTKTIDGKEWAGFTFNADLTEDDIDDILKEEDGNAILTLNMDSFEDFDGDYFYDYFYEGFNSGLGSDDIGEFLDKDAIEEILGDLYPEVNMTIVMPSDATSNVGKTDGNKVTIDFYEAMKDGKDIVITSALPSNGNLILYVGIGLVVVIAIVAVVLGLKNKNKKKNISTETPSTQAKENAPVQPSVDETTNKQE